MIVKQLAVESLRELSGRLGFAKLGIVDAQDSPNFNRFCEWLDQGYAGSMKYLWEQKNNENSKLKSSLESLEKINIELSKNLTAKNKI